MASLSQQFAQAKKSNPSLSFADFKASVQPQQKPQLSTQQQQALTTTQIKLAGQAQKEKDPTKKEFLQKTGQSFGEQLETGVQKKTGITNEGTFLEQDLPQANKPQQPELQFGDLLKKEIGAIGEGGPSGQQASGIKAIEDFNKNFALQQQEAQAKSQTQLERGTFTGGVPASQLFGSTEAPSGLGALPEGTPDIFAQQAGLAGGIQQAEFQVAQGQFENQEQLRENQLRSSLSKLSLGEEGGNVLSAIEGSLGKLSLTQLEALAEQDGLELTQTLKDSLSRDGKSAIEREKLTKEERLAENDFSQRQLSRSYDRAITDREEFNLQQDARLRRLAASFGGGKSASLGANVSVMKEAEKGVKAVADMRVEFADKTTMVSQRADNIIETYGLNVGIIQGQMSEAIENKYAEITNTIDDLMAAGVTNETELNNAVLMAKKDYAKTYTQASEKAFEAIQEQNQQFFDNQLKLAEFQKEEDEQRNQGIFGGGGAFGEGPPRSTNTTDSSGVTTIGPGSTYTRDDGTQGLLGENCIKYLRTKVSNLPFGLKNKADKQRAIEQSGFRDPSQVKVGDGMLTAEGDWGHGAKIIGIEGGQLILEEANYVTGQVTKGRRIDINDAKIYGFIAADGREAVPISPTPGEGQDPAIQTQVDQEFAGETEEFVPQNQFESMALRIAKGQTTELDDKLLGKATAAELNALNSFSEQLKSQGFAGISVQDLSPQEQLEAKSLSVDIFGKRAGTKSENVNSIAALKAEGLSNDDIQDRLREAGFGKEFSGTIKNVFSKLTIKGFSKDQRDVNREQLEDLTAEFGQDAPIVKEFILGLASSGSDVQTQRQVDGRISLISNISAIETLLSEFTAKGGDTGLFKGKLQKIQERLGDEGNPELANIGNQIAIAIQEYRKAISGAAFTKDEGKEYEGIFPSSGKVPALNLIKIASLKDVANRNADNFYKLKLGATSFNELFPDGVSGTLLGEAVQEEQPQQQQSQQSSGVLGALQGTSTIGGGGRVVVQNEQGQQFTIPSSQLDEAQSEGFTLINQ